MTNDAKALVGLMMLITLAAIIFLTPEPPTDCAAENARALAATQEARELAVEREGLKGDLKICGMMLKACINE